MAKLKIRIVFFAFAISCAHQSDNSGSNSNSQTTATQTCRKFASNLTDATISVTYNCTFNGSTTLTCTNGGTETMTWTYANLQTFVNERPSPVSVFNKSLASSTVIGSATLSRQHNYVNTYNGAGQFTNSTDSGSGYVASYTYSTWDVNNRPTTLTAAFTSGGTCTGRTYAITYVDGATRTAAYALTAAGVGVNCGSLSPSNAQEDINGNPVTSVLGYNYTVNTTATVCY